MIKDNWEKGLIGLGVVATIAGGIVAYDALTRPMTYEEYLATLQTYNLKLEEIKMNCKTDTRCENIKGEKRVHFGLIKNKKEVKQVLDRWIEEGVSEPLKYNR